MNGSAALKESEGFQIILAEGCKIIKLTASSTTDSAKEFTSKLDELIVPASHFVVNCELLSELNSAWLRALGQLNQKLQPLNKQMRLVFQSPSLQQMIKQAGLDSSLRSSPSLRQAMVDLGLAAPKKLDVSFINAF